MTRGACTIAVVLAACRMGFDAPSTDPDGATVTVDAGAPPDGAAMTVDAGALAVDALVADAGPCAAELGCTAFPCDGACFQFCPTLVSFDEAQTACVAWGGCLATIDTAPRTACLAGLDDEAWIGLVQMGGVEPAGGWQWVCGGAVAYTNWMTNEPNDGGNEDCGEVKDLATAGWNDENCSFARAYVCERP
jgi:hypothetical protein